MKKSILIGIIIIGIILILFVSLGTRMIKNNYQPEKQQLSAEGNDFISTSNHLEQMQEAETQLSNFKSKIATAITAKGVETESSATAETMAENIDKIETGSTLKKISIGTHASNTSKTYDIKSITSNYTELTEDNFYAVIPSMTIYVGLTGFSSGDGPNLTLTQPSISYNASTGILTVSALGRSGAPTYHATISTVPQLQVYMVYVQ